MGAISAVSVRWSKAQFRPKRPQTETATPPSPSAPSSSFAGGVVLKAIMAQLKRIDAHLDTLTTELYQVNTHVSRIAWQQARMGGFTASPSPSPSLEAYEDEDADDGSNDDDDEEDKDASSSSNEQMMNSQWLTLYHSWQKGGVILGWE